MATPKCVSDVSGGFTVQDVMLHYDISQGAAFRKLQHRVLTGELEVYTVVGLTRGGKQQVSVFKVPKMTAVDWNVIDVIMAHKPSIHTGLQRTTSLPLIQRPATANDYARLWKTSKKTTVTRLQVLCDEAVLVRTIRYPGMGRYQLYYPKKKS